MLGLEPTSEFPETFNLNMFVEFFTIDGVDIHYGSTNSPEKLWHLSKMIEQNKKGYCEIFWSNKMP